MPAARSRSLVAALWLAIPLATCASAAPQEPVFQSAILRTETYSQWPVEVASGDLNADGHADLVMLLSDGHCKVALADGEGGFTMLPQLPLAPQARDLDVADVTGDGVPDLLAVHDIVYLSIGLLIVRAGDGSGAFGPPMYHETSRGPRDLLLADVNGDGVTDAVVSCQPGGRFSLLRGVAGGGLLPKEDHAAGPHPSRAVAGDWNGDGQTDLAFANVSAVAAERGLTVLMNGGHGQWSAPVQLPLGASPGDLGAGDLDADGDLDLVANLPAAASVALLLNDGDGIFAAATILAPPLPAIRLAVADLDEDGDADLVERADLRVIALLNDGHASFPSSRGAGMPFLPPGPLLVRDVTGDGDLDVIAGGGDDNLIIGTVVVLEGRGDGSLGPLPSALGEGHADAAIGDLDGDGWPELLLGNSAGDVLTILRGTGQGFFGGELVLPTPGLFHPAAVAIADVNGDGDLDLVAGTAAAPGQLGVFRGDGALGFAAPIVLPLQGWPTDVAVADLDGDGAPELLATGNIADTVQVLRNVGGGAFAPVETYATEHSPTLLAVDDLDGDGAPDVVVTVSGTSVATGRVQVFRGNGDATLKPPLSVTSGVTQKCLATGDADGDGDADVVTGSSGYDAQLFLNDGQGALSPPSLLYLQGKGATGIALRDVDGDGLADLEATVDTSLPGVGFGGLVLRRGTGGGAFALPEVLDLSIGPGLLASDVDGDGALDLVVGPNYDGTAEVFLNQLGPWQNLGQPLAGTLGLPKQVGEGTLLARSELRITLTDARPLAPVLAVVGIDAAFAPFKGGVLVPEPDIVLTGFITDAEGGLQWQAVVPAGLAGLTFVEQFWLGDPAGPQGWAASNALSAEMH